MAIYLTGKALGFRGWRWVCVLFGAPAVLWAAWFYFRFRDRPRDHPLVDEDDITIIEAAETAKSTTEADTESVERPPEPMETIPNAGAWRAILTNPYAGAWRAILTKLEGRLEVVHVQSDRVIQVRERLARHHPCESPMPNESPDDGTILLFNPGLIVFLMCS